MSESSIIKCECCSNPATVVYIPRGPLPHCHRCKQALYFIDLQHPGVHSKKCANAVMPLCSRDCHSFEGVMENDNDDDDDDEDDDNEDNDNDDDDDNNNKEKKDGGALQTKDKNEPRMIVGGDDHFQCGYCGIRNMYPHYKVFERSLFMHQTSLHSS